MLKSYLERLTQGNFDREEQCWIKTDLDILKRRGEETGLTQFIDEVEERLLPLLIES